LSNFNLSLPNLKLELTNSEFLEATCDQINKDLEGLISNDITKNKKLYESPIELLTSQLCEIIHLLSELNKIQQFIYKVDLNENIFKDYITRQINIEEFSFQIIFREAQKIYLRNYFK